MLNHWRRVPVERKVGFGFGLFLALLVAISMVAVERMGQMNAVSEEIVTRSLPAMDALDKFNSATRSFRTVDYRYILTPDAAGRRTVRARFDELQKAAERALVDYRSTIDYRQDRGNYDTLVSSWKTYLAAHRAAVLSAPLGDIRPSAEALNGPMRLEFLKTEMVTTAMTAWNQREGYELHEEARVAYHYSRMLLFGLFLAAVLTGGGASLLITRNVRRSTQHVQARLEAQDELRARDQLYCAIVANASDVILIVDANAIVKYVSPAATELWGYPPDQLLDTSLLDIIHTEDQTRARTYVDMAEDEPDTNLLGELRVRRADGRWITCEVIANDQSNEPAVDGIVVTCRDITERKAFEEQLAHQAFHDPLSGLPNRTLFLDRLDRALLRATAQGTMVSVIFLDLDNFKVVNDSLGHEAGDYLLVEIATRLSACVRVHDTVARLGGDEFTILLEDLVDASEVSATAERIARTLQTPVMVTGHEVFTTASIGVSVSAGGHQLSGDMLRDADTAMYQAKAAGKAHHIVFDRTMNERATERLELEAELRRAIDNGEIRLHYQPIVTIASGRMSEIEALVRWDHPARGLMPPIRFIPLAEETGLILPLGRWVLAEACRQTREWQRQYQLEPPLTVSVNLSARQFAQTDLVDDIARVLSETGLAATSLKIEITETLMMVNPEATRGKLAALKALGVSLAIDDFGTGYSSMAYLSRFPLDTLKIDRSFVGELGEHAEAQAIVRAIITLAKTLGLQVTSEGIETEDQLARLTALGSDFGQGFLFSRPLTASALGALFASQHCMFAPLRKAA